MQNLMTEHLKQGIENSARQLELLQEALAWERQAHQALLENQHETAYEAHKKAAIIYSELGKYDQAGLCFTQAASCWNKHIGQLPLRRASEAHERAAREYLKARDYHAAQLRFSDAALIAERDGEFLRFSDCFYYSRVCERKYLWQVFLSGKGILRSGIKKIWYRFLAFLKWSTSFLNDAVWGYGEKPVKILGAAITVIFACAFIYKFGSPMMTHEGLRRISFEESLYFSTVTYTTVGYGDLFAISRIARWTASLEALAGITLTPLLLIGLTRRYLRIS